MQSQPRRFPDREHVKAHLHARAEALALELIPDGEREGREWKGHGPDGAKWSVVTSGGKTGHWQNFGTGTGGHNLLTFIRDAVCGGDFVRGMQWATAWLGGEVLEKPTPATPKPRAPVPDKSDGRTEWLRCAPLHWSDAAGGYLQARAIVPGLIKGPLNSVRCGEIWNAELHRKLAAMVCAVIEPSTGRHLAIHRTYLAQRNGVWSKAPVRKVKMVLGPYSGGLIPLTRGPSGRRWKQMRDDEVLLLAEGLENALSVAQHNPEWRSAAYVSAANIKTLNLPDHVRRIILVRDRDGENRQILNARDEAVTAWQQQRRVVELWEPPDDFKDANDWCRYCASHGTEQGEAWL